MDHNPESNSLQLVQALQQQWAAAGMAVELIETHISWVLLAGATAWKIKKPLKLPFLDFSTLALREHFCAEELRLNRRYAPMVYEAVVPISGTVQVPRLGDASAPIEFALRMRRFPPQALLSEQLAAGLLHGQAIDTLAQHLAQQHAQAAVAAPASPWGRPQDIVDAALAVLQRLQDQRVDVGDLRPWLQTRQPALLQQLLARRQQGWVRECHGDLHLANAVVLPEGVMPFDCIEFEPAMRWIDVQSDTAFMAMDLLAHGREDLAWRFVNTWLDTLGDHAGLAVLRHYMAYRALIRAMVAGLHPPTQASDPSSASYLALARRLAFGPPQPRLLLTHGLSGSGKSWLTQQLLERCGAIRLRSDIERKRLFGLPALADSALAISGGIYGPGTTERTYAELALRAQQVLAAGWPVIVDAACLRRAEREAFRALAQQMALPFTLLDCQAEAATLLRRVRERQQSGADASEADEAVLARQQLLQEPLTDAERSSAMTVHTDRPLDLVALAQQWLAAGRQ